MNDRITADVIVIGAGISGLTTAWRLQREGRDVLLLERAGRPGGSIRSWRDHGYLIEAGPNSTLETTPLLTQMIDDLGLSGEKLYADGRSDKRFILRGGRLLPIPMTPGAFLTTPLFSAGAKLRLFREPFIGPSKPEDNETVADFVRRRLGREFLDYAINPFVAGVYAGDPARLSVQAAFPKLFELEQTYGGLIKGQIRGARERRKTREKSKQSARMFSFREGMETLPRALASALRRAEYDADVASVTRTGDGLFEIAVRGDASRRFACRALVLAVPARETAGLADGLGLSLREPLEQIPYPPVAVAITVFRRIPGMHPLDGFGFLIPEKERRLILGTIFTSTIFSGRAPDDAVLLTSFIGGMRQPEIALRAESEILELVLSEQRALIGTPAAPEFAHVTRWERAIPQYTLGHLDRIARIERAERGIPGLFFCANYRGGISVGDCVKSADRTVAGVLSFLRG